MAMESHISFTTHCHDVIPAVLERHAHIILHKESCDSCETETDGDISSSGDDIIITHH